MRYDIAFFLCCCRSFLSSSGRDDDESFYDLLGVSTDACTDDLKRAYKRQSLMMHPDKLAQRGLVVTERDRDRFTRMRHAYEVLSDPRRRETYDAIGERGMKWIEEPLSVDPQELAHNFATSSVLDRSKIFAIFLGVYVAIFVLPILVCLMADGSLGQYAKWTVVLIPLWFWDAIILFYHSRVILMGPIRKPENVPDEEWVDPLPMARRVMAMIRFGMLVVFQILLALRLDGHLSYLPWTVVFVPLYLWDAIALHRKVVLSSLVVGTHDELELAIGKRLGECTPTEREELSRRYIVVPANSDNARDAAHRLISDARVDVMRILARIAFWVLLASNLDKDNDWSWWVVFLPVFGTSVVIVVFAMYNFVGVQSEAARMDPATFSGGGGHDHPPGDVEGGGDSPYAKMNGDVKKDDGASPLTDEEREELRTRVAQSAYRAAGTCLSQCFVVVMACVLIGKIEGAGYSLLIVISPFLVAGGIVLCCLACTIFCITEVDENAGMAEFDTAVGRAAAATGASAGGYGSVGARYDPPTTATRGRGDDPRDDAAHDTMPGGHHGTAAGANATNTTTTSFVASTRPPPSSIWDPELGEIWQNATSSGDMEDRDVAKRDETEESATDVSDAECRRIEENHSISSSQCDLD
jgi:hypothetical protein